MFLIKLLGISLLASAMVKLSVATDGLEDEDITAVHINTEETLLDKSKRPWNLIAPHEDNSYQIDNNALVVHFGVNVRIGNISFEVVNGNDFDVFCSQDSSGNMWFKYPNVQTPLTERFEITVNARCPYFKLESVLLEIANFTYTSSSQEDSLASSLPGDVDLPNSFTKNIDGSFEAVTSNLFLHLKKLPIFRGFNIIISDAFSYSVTIYDEAENKLQLMYNDTEMFQGSVLYEAPMSDSMKISKVQFRSDGLVKLTVTVFVVYPDDMSGKVSDDLVCKDIAIIENITSSDVAEQYLFLSLYSNFLTFKAGKETNEFIVKFASIYLITGLKVKKELVSTSLHLFFYDGYDHKMQFHPFSHQINFNADRELQQVWFDRKILGLYVKVQFMTNLYLQLQFYGCKLEQTYAVGLQYDKQRSQSHHTMTINDAPSSIHIGILSSNWIGTGEEFVQIIFPSLYRFTAMVWGSQSDYLSTHGYVSKFQLGYKLSPTTMNNIYSKLNGLAGVHTTVFHPTPIIAQVLNIKVETTHGHPHFSLEFYGSTKDYCQTPKSYKEEQRASVLIGTDVTYFYTYINKEDFLEISLREFYLITTILNLGASDLKPFLPSFVLKYSLGNDIFHLYNPRQEQVSIISGNINGPGKSVQTTEIEPVIGDVFRFYPVTSLSDEAFIVTLLGEKIDGKDIIDDINVPSEIFSDDVNVTLRHTMHHTKKYFSYDVIYRGVSDDGTIAMYYMNHTFESDTDFFQPFDLNTEQEGMREVNPLQSYMGLEQPESVHLKMPLSIPNNLTVRNFSLETIFSHYNVSRFTLYITKQTSVNIVWTEQRPIVTNIDKTVEDIARFSFNAFFINPFIAEIPIGNNVFLALSLVLLSSYTLNDVRIFVTLSDALSFKGIVKEDAMPVFNISRDGGKLITINIASMTPFQNEKSFTLKLEVVKPIRGFIGVVAECNGGMSQKYYFNVTGRKDEWFYLRPKNTTGYPGNAKRLVKLTNDFRNSLHLVNVVGTFDQYLAVAPGRFSYYKEKESLGPQDHVSFELEKLADYWTLRIPEIPLKRKPVFLCTSQCSFDTCLIKFVNAFKGRGLLTSEISILNNQHNTFVCLINCFKNFVSASPSCYFKWTNSPHASWKTLHPSIGAVKFYDWNTGEAVCVTVDGKGYVKVNIFTGTMIALKEVDEGSFPAEEFIDARDPKNHKMFTTIDGYTMFVAEEHVTFYFEDVEYAKMSFKGCIV